MRRTKEESWIIIINYSKELHNYFNKLLKPQYIVTNPNVSINIFQLLSAKA